MNKYGNKKVLIDGIKFDSIAEGNRYKELKLLQRAEIIKELELQPRFLLQESFKYGKQMIREISYFADFKYYDVELKRIVVEDVKSFITKKDKVYIIKKKLFLKRYGNDFLFKEVE